MRRPLLVLLAAAFVLVGLACDGGVSAPPISGPLQPDSGSKDSGVLLGAGATFPAVLYQVWFYEYNRAAAPGVKINYQPVGSGAGIEQFIADTIDFGATDAPMSDRDVARAPGVQHLPTVLGAVVLAYNLPGLTAPLRLDGATTASIMLGEITRWDDPGIAALNPGQPLPSAGIQAVHRADGSGTTFVLTDWLTKASPAWKERVGASKNPNWPSGIGGQGNVGVAQVVKQSPYSIGYLELNYAVGTGLPVAAIENAAGEFVLPTAESIALAAAGVAMPADYRVSITNAPGAGAYPVSSFTFLLLNRDSTDCARTAVLLHMLWWAYHDPKASQQAIELDDVPLPAAVVTQFEATLRSFTCGGEPVLPP